MKSIIVLAAVCVAASSAHAERFYAVRPLDGYVCARLNATEAQMLDPHGPGIFLLPEPKADAPRGFIAPGILFVRKPAHTVDGYTEVMQFNGQPAWIAADQIKPMDSSARCVPSVLSNGKIGIG